MDLTKQKEVTFTYQGESYKFPLSRSVNEPFKVETRPMFGASILTGEADYTNLRPDEVKPLVIQDDWRRGFQDEDYEDARKYAHSVNCDARLSGKIYLAPKKLSSISLPTLPSVSLTDGGLEVWTDANNLTNWTKSLGTNAQIYRNDTQERSGTYCARLRTQENGEDAEIYQDISWDSSYQGKWFAVEAYFNFQNAPQNNVAKIVIDDGVDVTWSSGATTQGSYVRQFVARKLDSSATRLRIRVLHDSGTNADIAVYVDDVAMISIADGGNIEIVPFGAYIVAACDDALAYSSNGTSFEIARVFDTSITDLCVYQDNLHIMLGTTTAAWYTSDLSTFTESDLYGGETDRETTLSEDLTTTATTVTVTDRSVFSADDVYAVIDKGNDNEEVVKITDIDDPDPNGITIVRAQLGTDARAHSAGASIRELSAVSGGLYMGNAGDITAAIADTTTTIRLSTDPTNDGVPWSTPLTVPNSTYVITDIVDDPNGNTLIEKQDGPYYAEDDSVKASIPSTLPDADTSVSYKGYSWKGWRFSPVGNNKLYRKNLSTSTVEDISIGQYAQGDEDMDGAVLAMTGDGDYLYVAINNGSKTEILAGRDETVAGSTSWVWHPIWSFSTDGIVSMAVSSVSGVKRLYAITDTYSDGVLVFCLPQAYSDPMLEVSYEYEHEGTFVTPWYVTEFVENDKYFDSVWIGAYNFDGYTSIKVDYQLEGDGEWDDDDNWTELGYCNTDNSGSISDNGSTRTLVYCKEQVTRFAIQRTSRKIRFRLTLKTNLDGSTDEISPVITRIRVDGRVEPSLSGFSLRKRDITLALSLHERSLTNLKTMLDNLYLLEAAGEPLDFEGPDNYPRKVKFSQDGFSTTLKKRSAESKDAEFLAIVRLEEI